MKAKAGKNSVVMVPGALNPLVKSVEFTNLDQDNAPYKMTLVNGMSGWGWDGFRKPAPVFHDPQNTLKLGVVFDGKRDPAAELQAFVKYYVTTGLEKAGMVWDGTKLVPMSMTPPAKSRAKAPAKAPAPPKVVAPADILNFIASELKKIPGVTVKAKDYWVVMEPGKLNPLVKNIEVICTKPTELKLSMALDADTPNPGRGWGWSPYSGHFTDRGGKEMPLRDPVTELPKVVTDILNQTKISGMIYNREKNLVPLYSPRSAPAAPAAPVSQTVGLDEITSALKRMGLGVGGNVRSVSFDPANSPGESPSWFVEPTNRQRLDHYVGSFYNPGEDDDPEGWDEDGWEEEYAGPLRSAAAKWLREKFGPGLFNLEVGEKGHLSIYLTSAGMKKFMPTGKTAAAMTVAVDGVTCKWVREPKRKGRMDMGRAPDKFRGWSLVAPDGRILAMISHTHDVPTYTDPSESPAWKILIRLIAKESDRAAHGAYRQYTLKARVPAPDGDTGRCEAGHGARCFWIPETASRVRRTVLMLRAACSMSPPALETHRDVRLPTPHQHVPVLFHHARRPSGFRSTYTDGGELLSFVREAKEMSHRPERVSLRGEVQPRHDHIDGLGDLFEPQGEVDVEELPLLDDEKVGEGVGDTLEHLSGGVHRTGDDPQGREGEPVVGDHLSIDSGVHLRDTDIHPLLGPQSSGDETVERGGFLGPHGTAYDVDQRVPPRERYRLGWGQRACVALACA